MSDASGSATAVGIDVGGTKILGGLIAGDGVVVRRHLLETPHDAETRTDAIVDLARTLADGADVPVGVGVAGLVDLDGVVAFTPNLDWRDAAVQETLARRLGVAVVVENDAAVAAWGEYRVGAAREASGGALMLTIGTGVGGGLVMDRRLIRGARGFAAEFGHIVLDDGGPQCPCGNRGCLEALASGNAIGRAGREAVAQGRPAAHSPLYDHEGLTGADVTAAAQDGDEAAVAVLAAAGHWLGVGIASVVNALDPEIVVIGGGGMHAGDLLLAPAHDAYHERIVARAYRVVPPVVPARLGNEAGIVGAALLARDGEPA